MADFGAEVETFRTQARAWLAQNFPAALKDDTAAQLARMQAQPEGEDARLWRERMGARGWGTPTWPAELGGGGLSRAEARVLAEEMARVGPRS